MFFVEVTYRSQENTSEILDTLQFHSVPKVGERIYISRIDKYFEVFDVCHYPDITCTGGIVIKVQDAK